MGAAQRGSQGRRSRRPLPPLLVATLLSAAHFASFEIHRIPIVWDTRYYNYFAFRVASGDVPYRDFFENKTPLSIFSGALLYRAGEALGVEPLVAIRGGYLAFAAAAGVLLFAVHRRLAGGRAAAGFLALLAYCGAPLLGFAPAIGVLPKMLMALCASAASLLVARRCWVAAGAAGMLAVLDWQVGGLALLGALAGVLVQRGPRLRPAILVAVGALAAAAPFLLYFAASGGLSEAVAQGVGTLLGKGEASAQTGLVRRLARIASTARVSCAGQEWLFGAGLVGLFVFPVWFRRLARSGAAGLAASLAVYHYGVVAFSLLDFQSFPDLFILLHSVVFFAGVTLAEGYRRLLALALRRRSPSGRRRRATLVTLAALALLAALARPSALRPPYSIRTPATHPDTTLEDQRKVYARLTEAIGDRRAAFVGTADLLFLGGRASLLPFVYWNDVTYRFYRASPGEDQEQTLARLLRGSGAEVWVSGGPSRDPRPGDLDVASENRDYVVTLHAVR